MKTLLSLLAMLFAFQFSYAQTNTFPTSGNAGIGTTSPDAGLEIRDLTDSKPANVVASPDAILKLSRIGTADYSYNESAEFRIGHGGPSVWGSQLDLYIDGASNQNNVPDQQVMTWLYNGNVGIGTTSPQNKLDIQGGNLSIYNTGAATGLAIGSEATGKTFLSLSTSADANGYGVISSVSVNGTAYGNTAINPNGGNVAIGTIDPQGHKLAVNGDIIATKIVVLPHANWPDYVFKPHYILPSLTEVKSYIDQNQHLPDMPSEKEIAKNGVDLGEIVKIQTKKIEELTLYLIEKDKQMSEQQKVNQSQQEQINQLKQQVDLISLSSNKSNPK